MVPGATRRGDGGDHIYNPERLCPPDMEITLVILMQMVSSLADLVIGLVITGKAFRLDSMVQLKSLAPLFYANFATSFFSDLFTALALCFYLYRSHTGYHTSTDSVVTTLMLYAINTGMIFEERLFTLRCSYMGTDRLIHRDRCMRSCLPASFTAF
ncbi:hypothetical protein EWM64_g3461 [Hericium alpestre]|uniref:DUF6534 domain-containing protein n=1 Tax=Hericium alpestre TaxID=135208 RepID=A0A4Z0A2L8_9AGAM|nr:hypothetical protein EWM64_g3461 [Hericium alpestre]